MATAVIKKVTHGKKKGQYRFTLVGDNGEIVGVGSEAYTQKHNVTEVITKYFAQFSIVDLAQLPDSQ